MLQLRTQIYLEPAQHAALLKEARRRGISLAGVIRELVDEHLLARDERAPGAEERREAALGLIGLGRSGLSDVSARADHYLSEAIHERIKERPKAHRPGRRRARRP